MNRKFLFCLMSFLLFFGLDCFAINSQEVDILSVESNFKEERVVAFVKRAVSYTKFNGTKEALKKNNG